MCRPLQCLFLRACLFSFLSVLMVRTGLADDPVGEAILVDGAVYARDATGGARLLDRGASIFIGDSVITEKKSFAVLKMVDGTRFSLRGDTELLIQEYRYAAADSHATYNLLKGGLRALTGMIGKQNPDANMLVTRVGFMGIRGTEFDVRLCEADCEEEEAAHTNDRGKLPAKSQVIGRVSLVKGDATAENKLHGSRRLSRGSPIYLGDLLATGPSSFLGVSLTDNSRMSVRPNSLVLLTDYLHQRAQPAQSEQSMNLLKGGLRMLTGAIGNANPNAVRVRTANGTIGIRGTGFDIFTENPTYTHVWQGEVIFCTQEDGLEAKRNLLEVCTGASQVLQTGQSLRADAGTLQLLNQLPAQINWGGELRPDDFKVDLEKLFGARDHDFGKAGLVLSVYDGHVIMFPLFDLPEGMELRPFLKTLEGMNLGVGESLFTNGQETYRLEFSPLIHLFDETIRPGDLNEVFAETAALFPLAMGSDGQMCTLD
jgi:hypothetical protein